MNRSVFRIGITGGIGTGKTLICKIFEVLQIPVYYADDQAKKLMHSDLALKAQIQATFGEKSYANEQLDRRYLASRVFNNPKALEKLNSYVHPAVERDFDSWSKSNTDAPYLLKEAALLFETGTYKQLDKTLLIVAPRKERIRRIGLRDPGRTMDEIRAIMDRQMNEEEAERLCDYRLVNDGAQPVLREVLQLHASLKALGSDPA